MNVRVIGAGLAGCEAAWQIAKRGIPVKLYEMKPKEAEQIGKVAHATSKVASWDNFIKYYDLAYAQALNR